MFYYPSLLSRSFIGSFAGLLLIQTGCSSQELLGQNRVASKSQPLICSSTPGEPTPAPIRPRWISPTFVPTQIPYASWPNAWTVVLASHCRTDSRFAKSFSQSDVQRLSRNCVLSASPDIALNHTSLDPLTTDQTHLEAIGLLSAEAVLSHPTSGIQSASVVAIVDDGVDLSHNDLSPNAWTNIDEIPANGIDDDRNGFIDDIHGWNFGSNIASPAPEGLADHGTHVAGLTAAKRGNGIGGQGVIGERVEIMALNVFGNSATTSTTSIVNAIQYAVENGADVINLSLGGRGSSAVMESTLQWAASNGVVIITAAGNAGETVSASNFYIPMGYAASIPGVIAVGSISIGSETLSSFSNRSNAFVEIAAPGSDLLSAGLLSTLPGSLYGRKQGTSMAAPLVSGAAALIRAWARTKTIALTAGDVEDILKSQAQRLPTLSAHIQEGRSLNMRAVSEFLSQGCD